MLRFGIAVSLVCMVIAVPKNIDGDTENGRGWNIPMEACVVNNWRDEVEFDTNILRVRQCTKCVDQIKDPGAELDKGKVCLANYMQSTNEACAEEIQENVRELHEMLPCMFKHNEYLKAERCLARSTGDNVQQIFTEASVCMLITPGNITDLMEFIYEQNPVQGELLQRYKDIYVARNSEEKKKNVFLPQAYCQLAAGEDDAKSGACKQCAIDAKSLEEGMKCYSEYLQSTFEGCNAYVTTMEGLDKAEEGWKSAIHRFDKCLQTFLMSDLMDGCTDGNTEQTVEAFQKTLECTMDKGVKMIARNAGDKVLKMLGQGADE